ncbi:septum formation initiator family protein [Moraxella nasovis]|uniref:septum formation initiator family protein n=1 Tax=Moraxella nasovis TaxID=2904121 RepID=UPI001F60E774|nr:septum formation initiator family protein [Moraxella nasovis]UNU72992.1 septum formation initiator family protein [Moraxella nasovis]
MTFLAKHKDNKSIYGLIALIILFLVVFILLQHQYWRGENGHANLVILQQQVKEQERINAEKIYTNNVLRADVKDLKSGMAAVEEHARLDLGLIKSGETFVQLSNAPITYVQEETRSQEDAVEPIDAPEL